MWAIPLSLATALTAGVPRLALPRQPQRKRLKVAFLASFMLTASLPFVIFDGWPGTLLPLLYGDDTQFAPRYSAWSFFRVHNGMTEAELENALGAPLEIWPYEGEFVRYKAIAELTNTTGRTYGWQYTRSPNDSNYRRRIVEIKDGRVVGKGSDFYLD